MTDVQWNAAQLRQYVIAKWVSKMEAGENDATLAEIVKIYALADVETKQPKEICQFSTNQTSGGFGGGSMSPWNTERTTFGTFVPESGIPVRPSFGSTFFKPPFGNAAQS
jgi:hypothetical protein